MYLVMPLEKVGAAVLFQKFVVAGSRNFPGGSSGVDRDIRRIKDSGSDEI